MSRRTRLFRDRKGKDPDATRARILARNPRIRTEKVDRLARTLHARREH